VAAAEEEVEAAEEVEEVVLEEEVPWRYLMPALAVELEDVEDKEDEGDEVEAGDKALIIRFAEQSCAELTVYPAAKSPLESNTVNPAPG